MTAALYDQNLLDDPETPVFNELLDAECDLISFLLDGDWSPKALGDPAILALAFRVDAADYELLQVPTVAEIEDDIDAGRVPLSMPEARHTKQEEDDEQPVVEQEQQAAQLDEGNRDS
jgi:hypothetical protein